MLILIKQTKQKSYLCNLVQNFVAHGECSNRTTVHFEPKVYKVYFGPTTSIAYVHQPEKTSDREKKQFSVEQQKIKQVKKQTNTPDDWMEVKQ